MMLMLRLAYPNFYLLDEPTNHLDIEGQEALESELLAHEATSLLVSHDRSFIRAVANRFWLINQRKLVEVDDPEGFFALAFGGSLCWQAIRRESAEPDNIRPVRAVCVFQLSIPAPTARFGAGLSGPVL